MKRTSNEENINGLDIKLLAESTAYHEAGHFVLAILCSIRDDKFEVPQCASITVIEGKRYGDNFVYSPGPIFNEVKEIDENITNQIFATCFYLLAGYTSTGVIYEYIKGYRFINRLSVPDGILTKDASLNYLSINEQLDYGQSDHDIEKVKKILDILYKKDFSKNFVERDKLIAIIDFIINQLCCLIKEDAVRKSIEIVKNKLLDLNGNLLENEDLSNLIEEVRTILLNVGISKYLIECKKAFDSKDWTIQPSDEEPLFNLNIEDN